MEVRNYRIPAGCNRISVKVENNALMIMFEPDNSFLCKETGEMEEPPTKVGQLAIMWNECREAIISAVVDIDFSDGTYQARNGEWYKNAIRFRNLEQYHKVWGCGRKG